jgi:HAD superfamily phosphoserine phosphatase-like hydrolase
MSRRVTDEYAICVLSPARNRRGAGRPWLAASAKDPRFLPVSFPLLIMKFVFDLDGTLTECETLPRIARHFNVEAEIDALTRQTVKGDIPFMESFIRRVGLLGKLDVDEVAGLLQDVPVSEPLRFFIESRAADCAIATGNFRGWVRRLAARLPCELHASEGGVTPAGGVELSRILRKEDVVRTYQAAGEQVVFIGDGNNDAEAMRVADVSVACGIVHPPARSVLEVADYAVYDAGTLARLLEQIERPQVGLSIVISAAGTGSRLGLGQTKSLIPILGRSLIRHQLANLAEVSDIRVVVGYQAAALIEEVLAVRRDAVFVFNHDYFHTRTAASLFLGSRHANDMVLALDGDLLLHPEDFRECLSAAGEFLGVSEKTTDQSVFARLDDCGRVVEFSTEAGDYEWSGPARLKRERIRPGAGHVYKVLEAQLPLPAKIVRARDIDTFEDYHRAIAFADSWGHGNFKIDEYYASLAKRIKDPRETRNKAPDFSRHDIDFVKRFAGPDKTLLDLGAGTGLLLNALLADFRRIAAVEKYPEFSNFIQRAEHVSVTNADLLDFTTDETFDVVTLFGVMNFFSPEEAESIYRKIARWLHPAGALIIKHQMGVEQDVLVDGFSEELSSPYFSDYRHVEKEKLLLQSAQLQVEDVVDIYPAEFNRWPNTHFYALVCRHRGPC